MQEVFDVEGSAQLRHVDTRYFTNMVRVSLLPHGVSAAVSRQLCRRKRAFRDLPVRRVSFVKSKLVVDITHDVWRFPSDRQLNYIMQYIAQVTRALIAAKRQQSENSRRHHKRRLPAKRQQRQLTTPRFSAP